MFETSQPRPRFQWFPSSIKLTQETPPPLDAVVVAVAVAVMVAVAVAVMGDDGDGDGDGDDDGIVIGFDYC